MVLAHTAGAIKWLVTHKIRTQRTRNMKGNATIRVVCLKRETMIRER
jgi:hypothetical protein